MILTATEIRLRTLRAKFRLLMIVPEDRRRTR